MSRSKKTFVKTFILGFFVCIAMLNGSCGQTKTAKLDALIDAYVANGQFNGTVLVADKNGIIYKKGFGFANMEWGISNQPDTKFRLGSITKQFTAMLILQLVSENKIKLDVPISTYLPDYPKKNGDIITIHHLLTHSSGIPDFTTFPTFREMMRDPFLPGEIISLFADSALEFTPGEKFQYDNSGYALLGYIIEKVCGIPYEKVLEDKILTPLKMSNTGFDHAGTVLKNRASGYNQLGRNYQNTGYIDMSIPYAAGALYSTVEDLFLWDRALYTEKLLPKKYLDLLFARHIPDGDQYYGYGWMIGKFPVGNSQEQMETISHSGVINGFNTLIMRIPADKSCIVLLNNTGIVPLDEMAIAINGILHDKPYDFPKKSMANALLDVIEKEGINAALSYYKQIKDSADYRLDEGELNAVGYQLLQSARTKEAAAVFKLNVDAFPNSFNVYDSYGEALLALGDTAEAINNYSKSVKLNPGNTNGLKVLKELGVNTESLIIKVPVAYLKLVEGDYVVTDAPSNRDKYWKIEFKEVKGTLVANDGGYRYNLVPVGDNEFINPDDGASLVFDTRDKNEITLLLFGKFKFKKVN